MYPLDDNDLDRLSREAAEQYDVQPGASGWETLENRLNRELPLKEEKERRRFLFWLFLIVLLAGGGLLWTMTNKHNNTIQVAHADKATLAENAPQNTNPADSQPSPNVGIITADDVAANLAPESITATPAAAGTPANATTAPADAGTTGKMMQPAHTITAESNRKKARSKRKTGKSPIADDKEFVLVIGEMPAPEKRETTKPRKQQPATGNSIEAEQSAANNTSPLTGDRQLATGNRESVTGIQETETALHPSMVAGIVWNNKFEGIKAPPLNPAVTPAPEEAPIENKQQKEKGLQIGLVAGPDMSNVKFTDMDKAGYNIGLQVSYRFSDRWSVNTGLFYTKKNYTAEGKDWTKTGWWRYTDMHSVQGYCEMFDIPLNVRYDFAVNKKQRWFASAGASSYIMKSEYYDYDYTYNGVRSRRDWKSDSTSTYLFSILNVSAGFERALNKRFSLQAEPYFKLPLKGLGYGKLDLNSYGIYFSVKYKLTK